ncbi:MAG: hypothetical protein ABFS21_10635 [Actinomycetota bacterium]
MRRIFALITAVGLMAALLALPAAALAEAEFTEYTGVEERDGPFAVVSAHGTDVVQLHFTSEWYDTTSDPRATGKTFVSGHLTLTDPATFTGVNPDEVNIEGRILDPHGS